jgi:hypothetical protein
MIAPGAVYCSKSRQPTQTRIRSTGGLALKKHYTAWVYESSWGAWTHWRLCWPYSYRNCRRQTGSACASGLRMLRMPYTHLPGESEVSPQRKTSPTRSQGLSWTSKRLPRYSLAASAECHRLWNGPDQWKCDVSPPQRLWCFSWITGAHQDFSLRF